MRLAGGGGDVEATWFALTVIGIVIAVDASRALVSARAAQRYASSAFAASALHFTSDLGGSVAVLAGLLLARGGHQWGDPVAALFVSALVLVAASRLIKTNVDVLMDRVPAGAQAAAREAIEELGPRVQLRRLRMRSAAGHHFADVVVAVPRTPSKRPSAASSRVRTWSCTSSRRTPRRSASVPTPLPCATRGSARCTTWSCSRSVSTRRSRST